MRRSSGAVLVTTLLLLSIIGMFTQQLMRNMNVHTYFASTMIAREKAKMLCMGGIEIAKAHLLSHIYDKNIKKDEDEDKKFLINVLPHLNRWQTFPLKQEIDGLDGEVKIAISCESGKINLNKVFDFKKKSFKPEIKPFLEQLVLSGAVNLKRGAFIRKVTDYLVGRQMPLDDLSQLLDIKDFDGIKLFYQPPEKFKDREQAQKRDISLMDLFTIWSGDEKIEPWFFSDALCYLFGLRRPEWNDGETKKDLFEKAIKRFNKGAGKSWGDNWDILLPLYNKRPAKLKDLSKILSQQFAPKVYTVISCGRVKGVEERVLAVLVASKEEKKEKDEEKEPQEKRESSLKKSSFNQFAISKVYWL